ncbi:hypothetical protein ANRL4_03205 [Anaerolineae bacterium]|nr:hypothetical protein ANRL4_03205 [Anaerolineae bacterium]
MSRSKTVLFNYGVKGCLLLMLLGLSQVAVAEQGILTTNVNATFTVTVSPYKVRGTPPEAIGIAGNRPPLSPDKVFPPTLVLHEVKGSPGTFTGTMGFPKGTARDLSFLILFRVEGLWLPEPGSMGVSHVVLLDSAKTVQTVSLGYDSVARRFVPLAKVGTVADDFSAAASLAQSAKQSAAAREYDYRSAVALLKSGRVAEAQSVYARFLAASPLGAASRESYDRFPIERANALIRIGKPQDAIIALRSIPAKEGSANYQAEVRIKLGKLLDRNGDVEEARSVLADVSRRSGVSIELKDESAIALAVSCGRETTPTLRERARQLLKAVTGKTHDKQRRRQALIALADIERRSNNQAGVLASLKEAMSLGTVQQRLAATVQYLDALYAAGDYYLLHRMSQGLIDRGEPGSHKAHLLSLDALALKRLGRDTESAARFALLDSAFASSPYTRYAAITLSSMPTNSIRPDSLAKGAQSR